MFPIIFIVIQKVLISKNPGFHVAQDGAVLKTTNN